MASVSVQETVRCPLDNTEVERRRVVTVSDDFVTDGTVEIVWCPALPL